MSSFADTTPPPPPRPKTPFTHVVYLCNDVHLSKEHLGSRGGSIEKQSERHQFHLFNGKHTLLSIFRTHAQKEYCKVLETKGIYIHSNSVLLLFANL